MKLSNVYDLLGRYPATSPIRVRLVGDSKLHYLIECGVHRAKLQAILASDGDGPYRTTGSGSTGYILETVSGDDAGPILLMRSVQIMPEQIAVPKPEAN